MSDKIRVGIIGIGGISYGHINGFLRSPDSEIVGLVDIVPSQLEKAFERVPELKGVPTYLNHRDMLAAGGLDAVEISSPHTPHFPQIMDSLDAGLHVLCEKPLVCTTPHAKAVIEKRDQAGKVVMVSYQRHFQSQYRYIRKMVTDGVLGDVHFISALQCQNWKMGQTGQWRQVPEISGGGQLNDSGSHLVDVILWTSGLTAESVYGYVDNRGTRVDVNSAISIKFTNGAQGTITIVADTSVGFYEDFTIWGTKGTIFYRNGKVFYCDEAGQMTEPTDMPEGGNPDQGFLDVILGRAENWVPAECGLRVIELTEAAWKSGDTGEPVAVAAL
jgi:predicted dehydrogenase